MFTTPTVALLCVQAFANSYGFYFFITWLPTYLAQARGMTGAQLAIFSGLPLMLGHGAGSELRRPLGYAMVGGLLVSQAMTLFTTPVIYLYLDRAHHWYMRRRGKVHGLPAAAPVVAL